MGALLARIPRKEFRMPCRPRKKQIRVLFIRIKQNLLFDLQGVMNVALANSNLEMITSHTWRVTIIELMKYKQTEGMDHLTSEMRTLSK